MKYFLSALLISLNINGIQAGDQADKHFTVLDAASTGIEFQNRLDDNLKMNSLNDVYHYNGSGVAVADFNNDGLQDLYFVSALYRNRLYLNSGGLKFRDVSVESGTADQGGLQTGVTTVDINADGWTDIYVSVSGASLPAEEKRNRLFVNGGLNSDGIPVFSEKASDYALDLPLNSTQASFFDYDRDGDLDMFLINHLPADYIVGESMSLLSEGDPSTGDRLYENRDGKFVEVSEEAGLVNSGLSCMLGIGIGDLNNDGWPDVYTSNDFPGKDYIYINNGDGTFTESVDKMMRHISYASMGNDLADFNNDGLIDIVTLDMTAEDNYSQKASMGVMNESVFVTMVRLGLHHQYMYNAVQVNNGISPATGLPVFSDIAQMSGTKSTDWSWSPLIFDMDNDGLKDLYISNGIVGDLINTDFLYYKNEKNQELREGKIDSLQFLDDILGKMASRPKADYFFRNTGDFGFEKKNGKWVEEVLTASNGSAYADLDNDGDLDLVVNNSSGNSFIYRNNAMENSPANYLKIRFEGPENNPRGIGTKAILRHKDGNTVQVQELYLSRGFQSSGSPVLHFGLGSDSPESLEITWPDGRTQLIKNPKINQLLTVSARKSKNGAVRSSEEAKNFSLATGAVFEHRHTENEFNDFERESLIPHKMSNLGPALAVADINNDGLDDFFVGGSAGTAGSLYVQEENGFRSSDKFSAIAGKHAAHEDVKASFFDADGDGDQDLYVVSGSNEFPLGSDLYQDRFYENSGSGEFIYRPYALPDMRFSGSVAQPFDYDYDGDMDLFVGGRQKPGLYPMPVSSRILKNESINGEIRFRDASATVMPALEEMGMVTDVMWNDLDSDGFKDLVIVGEWMNPMVFFGTGTGFTESPDNCGLSDHVGWWNCVEAADLDNDGDLDLIAGNLGKNYKYKASPDLPFEVYAKDFDNSGTFDIVLGYYNDDTLFPVRGRSCSSNQMPFIKQKFPTYDAFGKATLEDIYGRDNLFTSLHYLATNFASSVFINQGDGKFIVNSLPQAAQLSSINGIITRDVNKDGFTDLVIAGNLYGSEAETPRNDAGIGLYLAGDGKGGFTPVPAKESGLFIEGDVKDILEVKTGRNSNPFIISAVNNGLLQLIRVD